MKGDNFSPKEKEKSSASPKGKDQDFTQRAAVADTQNKSAATAPDTGKRKVKLSRDFSAPSSTEQAAGSTRLHFDTADRSPAPDTGRQKRKVKLVRDFSAPKPTEQAAGSTDSPKAESSRLQFTSPKPTINSSKPSLQLDARDGGIPQLTDKQGKKLDKLTRKAEKAESKYFKREKKLPKRHALKLTDKNADGKRKVKLHFEEQTKAQKETLHIADKPKQALKQGVIAVGKSALTGAVDGGGGQSSDEKALRTAVEKTTVTGAGLVKDTVLAPVHLHNWRTERKYKKFDKATEKTVKANTKLEYKKFRFEGKALHKVDPKMNPKPPSNPVSRALQKRRFMKQYQKALKGQSRTVGRSLAQAVKVVANLVTGHIKKIGLIAAAIVLIAVTIGSCAQGIGLSATGIFKGIFATSYPADDKDLSDADWYFSDLEAGLVNQIQTAEQLHSTYDEYNYFLNGAVSDKQSLINAIGHDPFRLLSYLSVMHEDFKFNQIQGNIQQFFNELFQLSLETVTQTKYRTIDNGDGTTSQESYTYYILNTRLTVVDWETAIQPYLASKEGERQYDEYIGTGGNHQMFSTPFNFYWYDIITCHYGGRDNPTGANTGSTTASGQEMHTGLDIGVPIGTPIYSIMDGTVTFAGWHDLYGNYVDVTDSNGNKSRYAHCNSLLVTVGQTIKAGQVIAESGKTGNVTGPHLHLEIFLNGVRVNPVFLVQYKPSDTESEG